jgi:cytochrome c oxidase subunit 4
MNESVTSTPFKYFLIYLSLMALLVLTYAAAHVNLGAWSVPVALLIAAAKALLVAIFFMELHEQDGIHRAAAIVGIFWLGILLTLTISDYISRNWLQMPGHWPQ